MEYARELGLGLKLIGTAERIGEALSVRVHPAFLYPGHPLASVNGPFNAVTVESAGDHRDHDVRPWRRWPQTATAVLGDVVSAMIPPASAPEEMVSCRSSPTSSPASTCTWRSPTSPACSRWSLGAGRPRSLGQVGRAEGHERTGSAGDGHPPGAESHFFAATDGDLEARRAAHAAARDPSDRGGVLSPGGGPD